MSSSSTHQALLAGPSFSGVCERGVSRVGRLRIDPLHSDVQRHGARPILDVSKQHAARRGTGGDGIRAHWIEERGLELDATDELACEHDEDRREIAGSKGVAIVLLAVDYPALRAQERLGPLSDAISQVEDEVMSLRRGRVLRIVVVMILDAACQGQDWTQTVPRRRRRSVRGEVVAQTLDRSSALR